MENESSIIRLVHYTTQEYFERTQAKWFPKAEEEIAMVCLTYLSFEAFEAGFCDRAEELTERLLSNPLYDYAAQHWGHHARRASTPTKKIIKFLESGPKFEAAGQALLCPSRHQLSTGTGGDTDPRGLTTLHVAAYFGFDTIMKSLLESDDIDPNSAALFKWQGDMTPLSYAAQMGHEAIVRLLLEEGNVDPDAKNAAHQSFGRTPLSYAAENGHESIVKLLISTEQVNINEPDTEASFDLFTLPSGGLTPLAAAAANGHYGIVKILLDHGAEVTYTESESSQRESQTALDRAAENGYVAIIELLRERMRVGPWLEKQLMRATAS